MAFENKKLCLIAHSSGNQIFHYVSNDDATAVETANYFNQACETANLKKGDVVIASLDLDGTPAIKTYMVSDISAGVVSVVAG